MFKKLFLNMDENISSLLAPYATQVATSSGRRLIEPASDSRTEYQRDRDRIIHSTAFRRLEYKTQVFANHEGDLFRTRLTHSIEVAQIARSCARSLHLNEDLVEAISLAHDLGHTPFGHAGQHALNFSMQDYGGFEHNLQSLRIVDELEQHYGAFDGLNLMFETREGILKRCSIIAARQLGSIGQRFIEHKQPSLEAQLANFADEIAYNNHDIDDGLRSGLLTTTQLKEIDFFDQHYQDVKLTYPSISDRRIINETIRRMINAFIMDLISTSEKNIAIISPRSLEDVRNSPPLIAFSTLMQKNVTDLKCFLKLNLYRHYQVNRMSSKAYHIIIKLFNTFFIEPTLLPPDYQILTNQNNATRSEQARVISDYIAGMTDRYAIREYQRLFQIEDV